MSERSIETYQSSVQFSLFAQPHQPETMVIKIRLARFGRRNLPFYNIVVAHARYANTIPRLSVRPIAAASISPTRKHCDMDTRGALFC